MTQSFSLTQTALTQIPVDKQDHIKCSLCGDAAVILQEQLPGYQMGLEYDIGQCPACDTCFSIPMVAPEGIYENIYRQASVLPGYSHYHYLAQSIRRKSDKLKWLSRLYGTYWAVYEVVKGLEEKKGRLSIVEPGSGLGYLTAALVERGHQVTGIDLSQKAVDAATASYGRYYQQADLYEYSQAYPDSCDLVVMTELIEHVPDPISFLKAAARLLRPGGVALVTTPNKAAYPASAVWQTELPPIHYWWFSASSMKFMAAQCGLLISFLNPPPIGLGTLETQEHQPFLDDKGQLAWPVTWQQKVKGQVASLLAKTGWWSNVQARRYRQGVRLQPGVSPKEPITLCSVFQKNEKQA